MSIDPTAAAARAAAQIRTNAGQVRANPAQPVSLDPTRATRLANLSEAVHGDSEDVKLRRVAKDLEGVFVAELFKAMRETVPQDGLTNGGMGEDIFTGMLDQHLAPLVGDGWQGGIGEALYRQLRGALDAGSNAEGGTE